MTGDQGATELRRGWLLILAGLVGTGCGISGISIYTVGVFTKPLADTFGWSRAEIQGLLTCYVAGVLIGGPIVGAIMDRRGVRGVTVVSSLGFGLGLAVLGLGTTNLFQFYAIGVLSGAIGAGTTSITWSRAIMSEFKAKRGFALGLALTGSGICAAIVPTYSTWLVATYGWRFAYVGLAILPALIAAPVAWVVLGKLGNTIGRVDQPVRPETGVTLKEAVRGYAFWGIGIGLFFAGLGTSGVAPHLIPLLTDRGLSPMEAAQIATFLGVAVVAGRVVAGYLVDRFWPPGVAAVVLGIPAIAAIILTGEDNSRVTITIAAMMVGFAGGAEFDLLAFLTARYLGFKQYGLIYGCMYGLFVTATGLSPVAVGMVFDNLGTYVPALYAISACFVASAVMMLTLGRAKQVQA